MNFGFNLHILLAGTYVCHCLHKHCCFLDRLGWGHNNVISVSFSVCLILISCQLANPYARSMAWHRAAKVKCRPPLSGMPQHNMRPCSSFCAYAWQKATVGAVLQKWRSKSSDEKGAKTRHRQCAVAARP